MTEMPAPLPTRPGLPSSRRQPIPSIRQAIRLWLALPRPFSVQTFGDDAAFDASSETMPGTLRSFVGFSSAIDEMANARVYRQYASGRRAYTGSALGGTVAEYTLRHAMRPVHGGWGDGRDEDER